MTAFVITSYKQCVKTMSQTTAHDLEQSFSLVMTVKITDHTRLYSRQNVHSSEYAQYSHGTETVSNSSVDLLSQSR